MKYASCAIGALVGACILAGPVQAQPTNCITPACGVDNGSSCDAPSFSPATNSGGTAWQTLVDSYTYTPDRRPGCIISLGRGSKIAGQNPHGLTPFWLDCNDDGYLTFPLSETTCFSMPLNTGTGSNGKNDSLDHLIWLMDRAIADGFRRILLDRPAGLFFANDVTPPASEDIVPSSAYWTLPEWKRTMLSAPTNSLKEWIAAKKVQYPTLEISVYLQYFIYDVPGTNDDGNPCVYTMYQATTPDYTSAHEMEVVRQNFQPWIDIGITRIWLDRATGPDVEANCGPSYTSDTFVRDVLALQQSSDYLTPVKFGYETFVLDVPSCATSGVWQAQQVVPDPVYSKKGAYIQSDELFLCGDVFNANLAWPEAWDLIAGDIEFDLWLGLRKCPAMDVRTLETMAAYRKHGVYAWYDYGVEASALYIVPETGLPFDPGYIPQLEHMRRVYDFGLVHCAADFNLDGLVNSTDTSDFVNRYFAYQGCGVTFYEGDVNDDGAVNSADISDYFNLYFAAMGGTCPDVNLGPSVALPPPCN